MSLSLCHCRPKRLSFRRCNRTLSRIETMSLLADGIIPILTSWLIFENCHRVSPYNLLFARRQRDKTERRVTNRTIVSAVGKENATSIGTKALNQSKTFSRGRSHRPFGRSSVRPCLSVLPLETRFSSDSFVPSPDFISHDAFERFTDWMTSGSFSGRERVPISLPVHGASSLFN